MGKSLTDTAKAVLMNEELKGVGGKSLADKGPATQNQSTLRPKSKSSEGRFQNPGSVTPHVPGDSEEDLGAPVVTPTDKNGIFGVADKMKKMPKRMADKEGGEMKPLREDEEVLDENVEKFIDALVEEGFNEEEIEAALQEEFGVEVENDDSALLEFVDSLPEGMDEDDVLDALSEEFDLEELDEEQLDELSKSLVSRYKEKASRDEKNTGEDLQGKYSSGRGYDKLEKRLSKRGKGLSMANKRLSEDENLVEKYGITINEHISALFEGEEVSQEFIDKAATIFEAALNEKLHKEVAIIEQAYAEQLEDEVEQLKEELSNSVDSYMNYVVEQWISDNEVAIESNLRTELSEDFISGLRGLFENHYVTIPESKVDILEELNDKVEELTARLNEELEENSNLHAMIAEAEANAIFEEVAEDLTETQAERFASLAESVSYTSPEEYARKLETLKESYFPTEEVKTQNVLTENYVVEEIAPEISGRMEKYASALGKTKK